MSRRDNQLNVYLSDDLYDEIEARATETGMSKSGYAAQVLETHVQNQLAGEINQQSAVERRLEELAAHATDEVTDTTDGLEEAILRCGVYSIATWELVKDGAGEVKRQQAMQAGTRRMRDEADHLGITLDPSPEGTVADTRANRPDSATSAASETNSEDDGDWYF